MKKKINNELLHADQLMPDSPDDQAILGKRAEMLAKISESVTEKERSIDYIRLILGESQSYGIPFTEVNEVIRQTLITPMPYVPDFVTGVINHRGLLLTIINLSKYFNITEGSEKDEQLSEIIICKCGDQQIGLKVTAILGSDAYHPGELDSSLSHSNSVHPESIAGIHLGKTAILNTDFIINDVNQKLNSTKYKERAQ